MMTLSAMSQFLFNCFQGIAYSARGLLKWKTFEPVSKSHWCYRINMFGRYLLQTKISCKSLSCPTHDDISAMPVYIKLDVDECDQFSNIKRDGYLFFQLSCSCDART